VDVIEVLVQVGDEISLDSPLVTLESDKATMEIPAPVAGRVVRVLLKVGDKVTTGTPIVEVAASSPPMSIAAPPPPPPVASVAEPLLPASPAPAGPVTDDVARTRIHAGPAMRRLARELGVDLATVQGSGRRARIVREDVVGHVKKILSSAPTAAPIGSPPTAPTVDFSRFGDIDTQPLSKIRRSIGQNLHRAWITVPHVTQFDEADITDLEAFRKTQSASAQAAGTKLTLLAFLVKVVTVALARFPDFNASLAPDGATLILKKYCHIGIAANTPRGLLVPVLRDANRKGLLDIAREVAELGQKARDGKLTPAEMQGGCFTISSLGGVSGTSFTPIINVPEVAILGISPAAIKPVWRNGTFEPRLLLPLSLSYDHRVIDGVAGAEFTRYLGQLLGDIRQILL
jgi:pyruvate dehydrogenase E2 component (dihydrolipoamide acetyltransferase)